MDKDRVEGGGKENVGKVKEGAGKLTGDERLKSEGKADKVEGQSQGVVGKVKDAVRDTLKK